MWLNPKSSQPAVAHSIPLAMPDKHTPIANSQVKLASCSDQSTEPWVGKRAKPTPFLLFVDRITVHKCIAGKARKSSQKDHQIK